MYRRLSAIMFADMVGYSALMQEDERLARSNRERNKEVLVREFRSARETLGWTWVAQGRFQEGLEEFEEITRRTRDPFKVIPHRAFALAGMGRQDEARQLARLLHERCEREPETSLQMDFALLHHALGETERALDYLEEAVDKRLGSVVMFRHFLAWHGLRDHPRFQALMQRIGGL